MADRLTDAEVRAEGQRLLAHLKSHRSSSAEHALVNWLEVHADVLLADPEIDAEIAKALRAERDVLVLREDGWEIQHSLACRPNMAECPTHLAVVEASAGWDGPPMEPGRYYVDLHPVDRSLVSVFPEEPSDAPTEGVLVVTIDLATGAARTLTDEELVRLRFAASLLRSGAGLSPPAAREVAEPLDRITKEADRG